MMTIKIIMDAEDLGLKIIKHLHLNGCVSSNCNMLHQRVLVKE